MPVVYIHRSIPRAELVALYAFADVAWVSPLRDGMNLVAKEYVACKPDGEGVLVLSSFAGAAAEMGEALLINPYDEECTASAIMRALSMDAAEQDERMSGMHRRVLRNDVFSWGDRFLNELDDAHKHRTDGYGGIPPLLPIETVLNVLSCGYTPSAAARFRWHARGLLPTAAGCSTRHRVTRMLNEARS